MNTNTSTATTTLTISELVGDKEIATSAVLSRIGRG